VINRLLACKRSPSQIIEARSSRPGEVALGRLVEAWGDATPVLLPGPEWLGFGRKSRTAGAYGRIVFLAPSTLVRPRQACAPDATGLRTTPLAVQPLSPSTCFARSQFPFQIV
jgi:hypothetical protein